MLWRRLGGDDFRVCYRGEDGQCDGGDKKSDKSVATFYFLAQMQTLRVKHFLILLRKQYEAHYAHVRRTMLAGNL